MTIQVFFHFFNTFFIHPWYNGCRHPPISLSESPVGQITTMTRGTWLDSCLTAASLTPSATMLNLSKLKSELKRVHILSRVLLLHKSPFVDRITVSFRQHYQLKQSLKTIHWEYQLIVLLPCLILPTTTNPPRRPPLFPSCALPSQAISRHCRLLLPP